MSTKGITKKNNPEYEERTGVQGQTYYKKREEVQKAADIDHNVAKLASNDFEDPTEEDADDAQDLVYEKTYEAAKDAFQEFEHDRIKIDVAGTISTPDNAASEYADALAYSEEELPIKVTLHFGMGNDIIDEANSRAMNEFYSDGLPKNTSVDFFSGTMTVQFDSLKELQEKQESINEAANAVKAIWDDDPVISSEFYNESCQHAIEEFVENSFDLEEVAEYIAEDQRWRIREEELLSEDEEEEAMVDEIRRRILRDIKNDDIAEHMMSNFGDFVDDKGWIIPLDMDEKMEIVESLRSRSIWD